MENPIENAKIEIEKNHEGHSLVMPVVVAIVISSIVGAFFGFVGGSASGIILSKFNPRLADKILGKNSGLNQTVSEVSREKIVIEDSVVTSMVEKSSPAVVSIVVSKDVPRFRTMDPFDFFDQFGDFFGRGNRGGQPETEKRKVGGGTGFFINADGMIVTNRHVVDDLQADYSVVMSDGKEYQAKVLARDPIKDFAIIKVEGKDFPVLQVGDSDSLKVGQTVIAIGNSLGEFSNTVSKGIISGLERNLVAGSGFGSSEKLSNIIQTDAAINPGNSGGPLLDINGNVIGINVAIAQGAQNVGFAVPINQVKKAIADVESKGRISAPFLGVRYVPVDSILQKENSLPFAYGVLVMRGKKNSDLAVIPGSPADKAGIQENDIILEINGNKIDKDNGLSETVAKFNVGDTITLKIWHKRKTEEVELTLEERK